MLVRERRSLYILSDKKEARLSARALAEVKVGRGRVARSPVFSGSFRISAPTSRLPDRSQNLPYLTTRSPASEINVLETFCSL